MNRLKLFCILTFTGCAFADKTVCIEDPDTVAQLNTVQSNLDRVSSSVMNCSESGTEHAACLCQNREIIAHFNSSAEVLFRENKQLEQLDLVRFNSADGTWVSQSLGGGF